jgi:hypothetical protein
MSEKSTNKLVFYAAFCCAFGKLQQLALTKTITLSQSPTTRAQNGK